MSYKRFMATSCLSRSFCCHPSENSGGDVCSSYLKGFAMATLDEMRPTVIIWIYSIMTNCIQFMCSISTCSIKQIL